VRFALAPVPAVGVCVDVTPETVLGNTPLAVGITVTVTVQLAPAASDATVMSRFVSPTVNAGVAVTPVQVPPIAVAETAMFASASVNRKLLSGAKALGFVKVKVIVDGAPSATLVGVKALAIVGRANACNVAVLDATPAPVCVVLITPVVFGYVPDAAAVTNTVIVQLLLAGMLPAVTLNVLPAATAVELTPVQLPPIVSGVALTKPAG
jgi:hypothetical protein